MAYKLKCNCRPYILFLAFMLNLQHICAQPGFSKVDQWMNANLEELGGRAVLMIFKEGKVVYTKSANRLSGKQKMIGKMIARKKGEEASGLINDLTENTVINIASCSKWLSAALVMTFVDEGKLSIEDSIGKFLPVMTKYGKGQINISQCLSHLTGIKPAGLKEDIREITSAENMDELMEKIARMPMEAKPGQAFHYSSIGLQIAAAVIEKIAGKDFETIFAERIAIPCEMRNTNFGHKKIPLAAGGARSTASDYLNFLTMILQQGDFKGKTVLKNKSIVLMQQNYAAGKEIMGSPDESGQWGYGYGEWVMEDAGGKKGSGAVCSPGLFGSFPYVDNQLQYAAVLFTLTLQRKGRHERYKELKTITDQVIANLQ